MADDKSFSQADLDAVTAKFQESIDRLEAKNAELVGDLRKARKTSEIKPEDLAAAEDRAENAEKALAEANKQIKTLATDRDKLTKVLEQETGAARKYAIDSELNAAIAEGNVTPALVPAFRALISQGASAELVDGQYVVKIGDKTARDHIKETLASEEGKHFVAAPTNSGGGAPGGSASGSPKELALKDIFALPVKDRSAAVLAAGVQITE